MKPVKTFACASHSTLSPLWPGLGSAASSFWCAVVPVPTSRGWIVRQTRQDLEGHRPILFRPWKIRSRVWKNGLWKLDIQVGFFFKPKFPILTCQSPAGYLNDLVKDGPKFIHTFIFNLENVNVVENLEDSLITGTTPWLTRIHFTRISLTRLFKKNPDIYTQRGFLHLHIHKVHTHLLFTLREIGVKRKYKVSLILT